MDRLHAVRPHQYQTAGKQRIQDIDVAPSDIVGKRTRTQDLHVEAAGAAHVAPSSGGALPRQNAHE